MLYTVCCKYWQQVCRFYRMIYLLAWWYTDILDDLEIALKQ